MPDPLSVVLGLALVALVLGVVVGPRARQAWVERVGVDATARVVEIGDSGVRDEHKRALHRVVLELRPDGGAPYQVTVTQRLPWLHGPGVAGGEVQVKVHPRWRSWVVVTAPIVPRPPG